MVPREFSLPPSILLKGKRVAAIFAVASVLLLISAIGFRQIPLGVLAIVAGIIAWAQFDKVRHYSARYILDGSRLIIARPDRLLRGGLHQQLQIFPYDKASVLEFRGSYCVRSLDGSVIEPIPLRVDGYDELLEALLECLPVGPLSQAASEKSDEALRKGVRFRYGSPVASLGGILLAAMLAIGVYKLLMGQADRKFFEGLIVSFISVGGVTALGVLVYLLGPVVCMNQASIERRWFSRKRSVPYKSITRCSFSKWYELDMLFIDSAESRITIFPWITGFSDIVNHLRFQRPDAWKLPEPRYRFTLAQYNRGDFYFLVAFFGLAAAVFGGFAGDGQFEAPVAGVIIGIFSIAIPAALWRRWALRSRPKGIAFDPEFISVTYQAGPMEIPATALRTIDHRPSALEHRIELQFDEPYRAVSIATSLMSESAFDMLDALHYFYPKVSWAGKPSGVFPMAHAEDFHGARG